MTDEIEHMTQIGSITDLKPKMCLQGTVKETQLYGAVIDIGLEYDGVVHISQLTPGRVNRVTDVVQPGDDVTVWVTKVSPGKGRIGLTMVKPPKVDWPELAAEQVHTGTVTRLESYGAFVDIDVTGSLENRRLEIPCFPFELHHVRHSQHVNVEVAHAFHELGRNDARGAVARREGLVQAGHPAAYGRLVFDQVDAEPGGGQVE